MKMPLSRRKFLAAAGGSALVLPFLRALPGHAQTGDKRYLILCFSGNGRVRHTWGGDLIGPERGNYTLRKTLASLEPYKDYVTVVNGLRNGSAKDIGGTHEGGMESLWTGVSTGNTGPSIDQLVGPQLGGVRPSIELHVPSNEDEVVRTRNNRMIFSSAGAAIDPRDDAGGAAAQLFAGVGGTSDDPAQTRNDAIRAQVFQQIGQELTSLKPRLCSEDQLHLEALRSGWDAVQQRLSDTKTLSCARPDISGTSENYFRDRSRDQIDVMVMALACDITRTASVQWSQGRSDLVASWLGINEKHHDISHNQAQAHSLMQYGAAEPVDYSENPRPQDFSAFGAVWDQLDAINGFYAEEFSYLLKRLSEFPVAGGKTLLDQSLVVWGSEVNNGAGHDHWNMPFLLAGGGAGRLKRGTVVNYPYINEDQRVAPGQRYHNDLLVTIAHILNVPIDKMGESRYNQGVLTELIQT